MNTIKYLLKLRSPRGLRVANALLCYDLLVLKFLLKRVIGHF
jgi:hypothetical protein